MEQQEYKTDQIPTKVDLLIEPVSTDANKSSTSVVHDYPFYDASFWDFTFKVQQREFRVVRLVIANESPVFKAMMLTSMSEGLKHEANLTEDNQDIIMMLLTNIYSKSQYYKIEPIRITVDNFVEYLNASIKYDVKSCIEDCIKFAKSPKNSLYCLPTIYKRRMDLPDIADMLIDNVAKNIKLHIANHKLSESKSNKVKDLIITKVVEINDKRNTLTLLLAEKLMLGYFTQSFQNKPIDYLIISYVNALYNSLDRSGTLQNNVIEDLINKHAKDEGVIGIRRLIFNFIRDRAYVPYVADMDDFVYSVNNEFYNMGTPTFVLIDALKLAVSSAIQSLSDGSANETVSKNTNKKASF